MGIESPLPPPPDPPPSPSYLEETEAFIRACVSGDATTVRAALDLGFRVSRQDGLGYTALHRLAERWKGNTTRPERTSVSEKIGLLLLSHGAAVNADNPSHDGWTPLHLAAWSGSAIACNFLVNNGGNVHVRDWYGQTPLQIALYRRNNRAASVLRQAAGIFGDRGPDDVEWTVLDFESPHQDNLPSKIFRRVFSKPVFRIMKSYFHDALVKAFSSRATYPLFVNGVMSRDINYPIDFCKRDSRDVENHANTARLYTPELFADSCEDSKASSATLSHSQVPEKAPLVIYIHGGGWTIMSGKLSPYDRLAACISRRLGVFVLSIDYRLAPEHPFPAAPNDCYGCLAWLGTPSSFHVVPKAADRSRIVVMGDSAGGNLTAVTCLMYRDLSPPGVKVAHQVLIYPCTFKRPLTLSRTHARTRQALILSQETMLWFEDKYRGKKTAEEMSQDPYANPEAAQSLAGCVPTSGIVCGADILRDEGVGYFRSLARAGSSVDWRQWDAAPHGCLLIPGNVHAAQMKAWLLQRIALILGVRLRPLANTFENSISIGGTGIGPSRL